jgi:hypothetical protein
VANGFGFGGIVTIASALPQTALLSSAGPFTINGVKGIDGGATGGTSNNASSAAGRSPQFPRNFFRGPTQVRDVDFHITRDFALWKERYKLQVIAEAFNLFNHTIVSTVTSSAYAIQTSGTAADSLTCTGASPCLVPQPNFLAPTATSSAVTSARQLQISGKFFF